ncbi:uncharacterized protein LOC143845845 [Tasmannia lanceolata]|uniref:uncharacterized protein LOC143845845 n=1 Tax=Tasmannia lanceolata TaxID=3420 RepID=UPI0040646CA2
MEKSWVLPLLLLHILSAKADFNGVHGMWIGGGISSQTPSGFSNNRLSKAFTALQAWKSAITDDPFKILDTWVGSDVCSYKGVFCTEPNDMSTNTLVVGIDLNHFSLKGSLVKELSLLSDITIFHLNSNKFSGTIPDSFRDLINLSELDLSNNQFSGPFPSVTILLPNLIYLDIRFNQFSGPIPEDLFNKNLDAIFLNNNQFEGQLPQNLGNSPASVITFANNNFSGTIPFSFSMVSQIKEVLFLNNQLTGCIPEGIGFFSDIEVLDLSFNLLSGHLPDSLSCLSGIEVLNLGHNQLSGFLPDSVCSLRNLEILTVSYNFFSGFSQECTTLFFRNVGFDFSGNCIPGRNMQRPPPDCSGIPGGLNCLRIPSTRPMICSSMYQKSDNSNPYIVGPPILPP